MRSTVLRWLLCINIVGLSLLLAFVFDVESQLEATLEWIGRHQWLGASLFIAIYAASTGTVPSCCTLTGSLARLRSPSLSDCTTPRRMSIRLCIRACCSAGGASLAVPGRRGRSLRPVVGMPHCVGWLHTGHGRHLPHGQVYSTSLRNASGLASSMHPMAMMAGSASMELMVLHA